MSTFTEYLNEMSFPRTEVIAFVRQHQRLINRHFAKIIFFPTSTSINHWKHEINTWLYSIAETQVKGNKQLSALNYRTLLWEEPFATKYNERFLGMRNIVFNDEENFDSRWANEGYANKHVNEKVDLMKRIYMYISEALSKRTFDHEYLWNTYEAELKR